MGCVTSLRDYDDWHRHYDDPASSLSWRLRRVQEHLNSALDRSPGPCRILSACAGDGRDVIGVLRDRSDADRVSAVLIELHSGIAQRARDAVTVAGLTGVEVRTADAGRSDAYAGIVPAQIVLLVERVVIGHADHVGHSGPRQVLEVMGSGAGRIGGVVLEQGRSRLDHGAGLGERLQQT